METRTVIANIDVNPRTGVVNVRFLKQVLNGDSVVFSEPHLTEFRPGMNVDAQMEAVNAHLQAMGYSPVTDYSTITAHCEIAHG